MPFLPNFKTLKHLKSKMQESGVDLDFDQILELESDELIGANVSVGGEFYQIVSKPIIER